MVKYRDTGRKLVFLYAFSPAIDVFLKGATKTSQLGQNIVVFRVSPPL